MSFFNILTNTDKTNKNNLEDINKMPKQPNDNSNHTHIQIEELKNEAITSKKEKCNKKIVIKLFALSLIVISVTIVIIIIIKNKLNNKNNKIINDSKIQKSVEITSIIIPDTEKAQSKEEKNSVPLSIPSLESITFKKYIIK